MGGKKSLVKKFEAKLGLFTKLYVKAANSDKWLQPDQVWAKALADVIRSGNPDVGEVVSNTSTLKAIVHYGADGTETERKWALALLDNIFGRSTEKQDQYKLVVKKVESDEMLILKLSDKEAAEKILGQMKRIVRTRENLRLFLIDLDAAGKMYAGFSIDCAKKSGLFNVPYLTKCKMLVGAMFRIYSEVIGPEGFGMKMLKPQDSIDDSEAKNVSITDNDLVFWTSPAHKALYHTKPGGKKQYILDPVSRCLEGALEVVGPEFIKFFGEQDLPKFPEGLKRHILDSLVVKNEDDDPAFSLTSLYMRYMLGVWTTLTNWKLFKIREVRAMNNGGEDEEQEAAIKSAASPGFTALRKEIRRGARYVSGMSSKTHTAMGPNNIAAAALGASYMDSKGQAWVEDEAEAKSFAMTALVEESNLLLHNNMGKLGDVTEIVTEKLNLKDSVGVQAGMTLNFEDGAAVIMDEDENEIGVAIAMKEELEGFWTVVDSGDGQLMLCQDVHGALIDLIPQGDEKKRVFVTSNPKGSDKSSNALFDELLKAQISKEEVVLTRYANKDYGSNAKVPQAIVIGNKIVGVYRTPFVDQQYRDIIVDAIGNCKGKIERLFNFRSEDEGWITVVCLEQVELLSKKESAPNGLINMIEKYRQEAAKKRQDDLNKAQEALSKLTAGIKLY